MQRQDLADAEDEYNDLRAAFDAFKVSYLENYESFWRQIYTQIEAQIITYISSIYFPLEFSLV